MSDFNEASARAHSRAAVYQAIEDAYSNKKYDKSSSNEPVVSQSSATNSAVAAIMNAISDKNQKSRQFITEMINGKQIVLENVKTVRDLKSNKAKRSKKRGVVSNKVLKKKGLCTPEFRPCNGDVSLMHDMWWSYIKAVIKSCQSEVQLQARLHASEMIGARIIVIESKNNSVVGVKGIVTAVSGSCYYLLVDTIPGRYMSTSDSAKSGAQRTKVNRPRLGHVLRLIKEQCNLGVILPPTSRMAAVSEDKDKNGTDSISSKTPVKSSTAASGGGSSGLNIDTSYSDDEEVEEDDDEVNNENDEDDSSVHSATAAVDDGKEDYTYKVFDWNERTEGAKICILYGKLFMPNCLFDSKQQV